MNTEPLLVQFNTRVKGWVAGGGAKRNRRSASVHDRSNISDAENRWPRAAQLDVGPELGLEPAGWIRYNRSRMGPDRGGVLWQFDSRGWAVGVGSDPTDRVGRAWTAGMPARILGSVCRLQRSPIGLVPVGVGFDDYCYAGADLGERLLASAIPTGLVPVGARFGDYCGSAPNLSPSTVRGWRKGRVRVGSGRRRSFQTPDPPGQARWGSEGWGIGLGCRPSFQTSNPPGQARWGSEGWGIGLGCRPSFQTSHPPGQARWGQRDYGNRDGRPFLLFPFGSRIPAKTREQCRKSWTCHGLEFASHRPMQTRAAVASRAADRS